MTTLDYLHTKSEEFKLGYFAAMNEKHGNADFVVRSPSGNYYEAFDDIGAAIKSMKPVSRLFAPLIDGPVSSATTTPTPEGENKKQL